MLNNKSGMLKIVALVLSALMLVSLAACNKGIDDETMQNAIDAAIASQKAEQDAANAALQSSIAAEQAAQDAANAALQSSIIAEQAKQSEALAAASKAQADAAASVAAASKAASEAAASASKAAADAAAASKQAAEASKQAASASAAASAQASASASASVTASISASISASEAALTTTAPAKEDITSYVTKFAELRAAYLLTNKDYYLAENYKKLDELFVEASIELGNASTIAQAEAIYTTLEVDAAGIESAKTRANEVKALIDALNDIETEVFTTQADMIVEALDALADLNEDYEDLDATALKNAKKVINVADLNKAKAKLGVLEAYIASSLQADMAAIYKMDPKVKYDAEDDLAEYQAVVEDAYYKYLVLNKINGGDTAAADLAVEIEYFDKNGKEVDFEDWNSKTGTYEVVKTFTVESLIENYILPTLDAKFELAKEDAYKTLVKDLNKALYTSIAGNVTYIAEWSDVEDLFEDVADQFELDIEDLTFTGDFKGKIVYDDALVEINKIYAKAYVDAVAGIVEISREIAIEAYTEAVYEPLVESLEKQYEDEKYADTLKAKLDMAAENLAAFKANVEAAPVYDFDSMNDARAEGVTDMNKIVVEGEKADLYEYVIAVVTDTIANNFKTRVTAGTQAGMLRAIVVVMVEDLQNLRVALNVEEEGALWKEFRGSDITPIWVTDSKTYKNDATLAGLVAKIDAAIEALESIDEADYNDQAQVLKYKEVKDSKNTYYSFSKKNVYFQNKEAYDFYVENDLTEKDLVDSSKYTKALLTTTKTDYPVTTEYSATAQACVAAQKVYSDLYTEIHNALTGISNPTSKAQELITKDAAYKAVVTNVSTNSALKSEVEAFATKYTGEMAKLIAIGKVAAVPSCASTNWELNKTHITLKADDLKQASTYTAAALSDSADISGVKQFGAAADKMYDQFETFEGLFWADKATKTSNVVELYKYKVAAVSAIEAEMVKYVNKYTTDKDGVVSVTAATAGTRFYNYDGVIDGKKAASATLYENALATLVDTYSDLIMAVKLDSAAEIKSVAGGKVILAKGTAGIANAKAMVDAYQTKLFGLSTTWTLDEVTYPKADSETFLAYKQYILVNYDTIDSTTLK